ncbi:MAG: hypothetical protein WA888_05265 [Burkholderiaceae bacterium]
MEPEQRFATPVTGPAYGWFTRTLACAITAMVVLFAVFLLLKTEDLGSPMVLLILGGAAAMSWTTYYILTGKTTIDSEGVRQDWFSGKTYKWDEIRKVSMLRLPMATRLVINTGKPPFKAVHSGSPVLTEAFEEIVRIYKDPTRVGKH